MKVRPVGAELVHANRRTDERTEGQADMAKLIVDFRSFANAPENRWQLDLIMPYNTNIKKTALFNHDGVMVL